MVLGIVAAALLWSQLPSLHSPTATRLPFLFALGIATGVTALPVLSAILIESNHIDTPVGQLVIANATFHDGILWILLAILLTYTDAGSGQIQQPLVVLLQLALYLAFMLFVMQLLLARLVKTAWWTTVPEVARLALVMVGLLLSAWVTESIGVHYLIGAVLYGAILPGSIKKVLIAQVEPVVVALLLPFFFVSAGLHTRFDLAEPAVWIVFVTMTVMKLGGQFVGTTLPLRLLFGRPWPFALQSGAYMACSGIVEIVVLGLAYEQGILSGTAYAGMILSALAATAATKPLVAAFGRLSAVQIQNPIIKP
jgi:Kef-type K+ transport system membrane component KefB